MIIDKKSWRISRFHLHSTPKIKTSDGLGLESRTCFPAVLGSSHRANNSMATVTKIQHLQTSNAVQKYPKYKTHLGDLPCSTSPTRDCLTAPLLSGQPECREDDIAAGIHVQVLRSICSIALGFAEIESCLKEFNSFG